MTNDRHLLYAGVLYALFVSAAVYWLGVWLQVSGSLAVRVLFSVGCGGLAALVFLFSYLAGKRRKRDE